MKTFHLFNLTVKLCVFFFSLSNFISVFDSFAIYINIKIPPWYETPTVEVFSILNCSYIPKNLISMTQPSPRGPSVNLHRHRQWRTNMIRFRHSFIYWASLRFVVDNSENGYSFWPFPTFLWQLLHRKMIRSHWIRFSDMDGKDKLIWNFYHNVVGFV